MKQFFPPKKNTLKCRLCRAARQIPEWRIFPDLISGYTRWLSRSSGSVRNGLEPWMTGGVTVYSGLRKNSTFHTEKMNTSVTKIMRDAPTSITATSQSTAKNHEIGCFKNVRDILCSWRFKHCCKWLSIKVYMLKTLQVSLQRVMHGSCVLRKSVTPYSARLTRLKRFVNPFGCHGCDLAF